MSTTTTAEIAKLIEAFHVVFDVKDSHIGNEEVRCAAYEAVVALNRLGTVMTGSPLASRYDGEGRPEEETTYTAPEVTISRAAATAPGGEAFAIVASVGGIEVSRADVYGDEEKLTIRGGFSDNYAVEHRVRDQIGSFGLNVAFDSEHGQFCAYAVTTSTAEHIARLAVEADVAMLIADEAL
jgi:hypothetical protein